jgi:hypothetical protein
MTTTRSKAPEIPNPTYPNGGYPTKGRKIGPAWQDAWRVLEKANGFLDGKVLSEKVAPRHDLSPSTLVAILSRAEKAGLLVKEMRPVQIEISRPAKDGGEPRSTPAMRVRAFYRITP